MKLSIVLTNGFLILLLGCASPGDDTPAELDVSIDGGPIFDASRDPDSSGIQRSDGGMPTPSGADLGFIAHPLPEVGPLGAAGRVVMMDVPLDVEEARQSGCLLSGGNVGTGTANLVTLGGGLDIQVQPNALGEIRLILLVRASDWPSGESALERTTVSLELAQGQQLEDEMFSFKSEDRAQFPDTTLMNGWFETRRGRIVLPLALVDSPPLPLELSGAHFTGRLGADSVGLKIEQGTLAGYLMDDSLRVLLGEIQDVCDRDLAPGLCGLVGNALSQSIDELFNLIIGIMGGLDARLVDGRANACDPQESEACNAVSVCVVFEASGVALVATPPEESP